MPGILLTTGIKYSLNGETWKVSIIDFDAITDSNLPMILSGLQKKNNDDDYNTYNPIATQNITIDIVIDANVLDFVEDFVLAGEGRYYLEILQNPGAFNEVVTFKGRLIINDLEIGDDLKSAVTITAIDGFTLLKNVDFDMFHIDAYIMEVSGVITLKNIIISCLNKIDAVINFKVATDPLVVFSTNYQLNQLWVATDDPMTFMAHMDYWTKVTETEGDVLKKYLPIYTVLEDIFKRYGLRIDYVNGVYYIRSYSSIYNNDFEFFTYAKNGSVLANFIVPFEIDADDDNPMLAAGRHNLTGGVKSVTFKRKKDFINDTNIVTGRIVFEEEQFFATLFEAQTYNFIIRQFQTHTLFNSNFLRKLKLQIKIEIAIGATSYYVDFVKATEYMGYSGLPVNFAAYTLETAETWNDVLCDSWGESSEDWIGIKILPASITETSFLTVTIHYVGYINETGALTGFPGVNTFKSIGELDNIKRTIDSYEEITLSNDTNNYNTYVQEVYASETYVNYKAQGFLADPADGIVGTDGNIYNPLPKHVLAGRFKVLGQDSFSSPDLSLLEEMLKISTPIKKLFIGEIQANSSDFSVLDIISFKANLYIIRSMDVSLFDNKYTLTLHNIGIDDTVVVVPDYPPDPPLINKSGFAGGNVQRPLAFTSTPIYEEFVGVTGVNYVTLAYVFPTATGLERAFFSDRRSVQVWLNGQLQRQVYEAAEFDAHEPQYYIVGSTRRIYFNRTNLSGSCVQVMIHDYFTFGVTS